MVIGLALNFVLNRASYLYSAVFGLQELSCIKGDIWQGGLSCFGLLSMQAHQVTVIILRYRATLLSAIDYLTTDSFCVKTPELVPKNNYSFHISGYCAATTPLFAVFYEYLGLPPRWIAGLDVALALAFIFSFIQLVWYASALYARISSGNLESDFDYKPTIFRNVVGFLLIVVMGSIGFYFITCAIPSYPALYSATIVGFISLSSALLLFSILTSKNLGRVNRA